MHRIAVLTEQEPLGTWLEAQISRFCREKGLFTQIRQYRDQESFFKAVQLAGVSHTVIALQGIAGLNARSICERFAPHAEASGAAIWIFPCMLFGCAWITSCWNR